jgi:DNA-binding transcriptional MerR regulator
MPLILTSRQVVGFGEERRFGGTSGGTVVRFEALKIGELARRTGLTIRTLHHYDAIGLLKPSLHTESGHRLYLVGDVARLQQVLSLRQLGLSLEEVRDCLDRPGFSPREVIGLHLARLREQIDRERKLCQRLEALAACLDAAGEVSAAEFLQTIEEMTMLEQYYTPEQMEYLKQRRAQVGEERIEQSHGEWAELIAQVRAERDKGTDPTAPPMQVLAKRWLALLSDFTGGDAGIAQSLGRMWQEQGDALAARHGTEFDARDVFEYVGKALATVKGS